MKRSKLVASKLDVDSISTEIWFVNTNFLRKGFLNKESTFQDYEKAQNALMRWYLDHLGIPYRPEGKQIQNFRVVLRDAASVSNVNS